MYDKCYFCLDQLPKLKKESTASFFVNFGGAGVQKSRPTLLYKQNMIENEQALNLAPQVGEGKPELLDDWDQRLVVSFWHFEHDTVS